MKHICLDCLTIFKQAQKKELPDQTGQIDLIIDVCPQCISEHIEPAEGKYVLVIDEVEYKHLSYSDGYFQSRVKENLLNTNDPVIAEYYRGLLMLSDLIMNNIKKL